MCNYAAKVLRDHNITKTICGLDSLAKGFLPAMLGLLIKLTNGLVQEEVQYRYVFSQVS